jgi:hypothetical protein
VVSLTNLISLSHCPDKNKIPNLSEKIIYTMNYYFIIIIIPIIGFGEGGVVPGLTISLYSPGCLKPVTLLSAKIIGVPHHSADLVHLSHISVKLQNHCSLNVVLNNSVSLLFSMSNSNT